MPSIIELSWLSNLTPVGAKLHTLSPHLGRMTPGFPPLTDSSNMAVRVNSGLKEPLLSSSPEYTPELCPSKKG